MRSRSPLTGGRARKGGGAGRHPGLFSQTRGALQRTQVAVERATPLETAWISFLLIQELFNVLELNAGKGGEGGGRGSHKGVDKSTSAKRVRGPPLVWSPVSADAGSGGASPASFFLEGHTRTMVGTGAPEGAPPRAAEGEPRGLLVL